ncbi:MAG TPA: hypothetical protein DHN33_08105 [Eubacteriaceae bacterium]|nr:hypothetical protein [Eubacteriaceae bacterium]
MKKGLTLGLAIVFAAIFVFGGKIADQPIYSEAEIEQYNNQVHEAYQKENDENQEEANQSNSQEAAGEESDLEGEMIRVIYPEGVEEGDRLVSSRITLEFESDAEIISATMNGLSISTTQATITTPGEYLIEVEDENGRTDQFVFTLVNP